MKIYSLTRSRGFPLLILVTIAAFSLLLALLEPDLGRIEGLAKGMTVPNLIAVGSMILALTELMGLLTKYYLVHRGKPQAEGAMITRLYRLAAVFILVLGLAWGFNALATFGTLFTLFGGMILGWSLQAPVSGFAAWILVSMKRPFRPGDRIQFPNLGLTGDVKDIGVMYTMLDQVGGSIGSEEAVGRYVLVPNAMLFSQVVINYTVTQEAAYMLDEVVIRITYDSDWKSAERILLNAATEATKDIIKETGAKPYIRSDYYDYGVFLRLRYQTRVKDRVEIAYNIHKLVFQQIQQTPTVDLAIPYVYSYRAGLDRKEQGSQDNGRTVQEIEIDLIIDPKTSFDPEDIEQLSRSIREQGLLQPVLLIKKPQGGLYETLAGQLRFAACKNLGWKTIPAIVKEGRPPRHKKSRQTRTVKQVAHNPTAD